MTDSDMAKSIVGKVLSKFSVGPTGNLTALLTPEETTWLVLRFGELLTGDNANAYT